MSIRKEDRGDCEKERRLAFWLAALVLLAMIQPARAGQDVLDLTGRWRFGLDQADAGVDGQWPRKALADQIQLPGALQSQGYGDEISTNTPWVLSLYDRLWYLREDYRNYTQAGHVRVPFICQPPRHYLGAAWYQRDIEIPADWRDRRIVLFLERPHWQSTVWLDELRIGSCNSLVAPHVYGLGVVAPGKHTLSVRVDNRMILPYRPDAHSVSDSLGGSWNGIVGRIELRATSLVWIDDAQVFPNVVSRSAVVKVRLGNISGKPGSGTVRAGGVSAPANWNTNGGELELTVPLPKDTPLWDEFNPALQRITVELKGELARDRRDLVFGLREFRAEGHDFVINGRKTNLRGTHNGGDFPLTGYPPTDVDYWRKVLGTCREWGLNHMRFHSFCPPEAAFVAADELGFYLQPECGMWNEISPGSAMERMLDEETSRMIRAYGNHPSFVMLSPSNEPKGRWKQSLPAWVERFRRQDPRRLYTTGTGWSLIDSPGPVQGADYLSVGRIGSSRTRGESAWFGRDYAGSLAGVNVPVVAHELGQWCAYPDFRVIEKFTGYMQPGNYEIFRGSLAAHKLLAKDQQFARASGRFQFLCYKEEIEANLRTPGLGGFQLLDLHDYVGQGTALVGVLDPFWEPKGYATAEEFRHFCNSTVPLARLRRRVFTTAEPFEAAVEVAHYGAVPLSNAASGWRIVDAAGVVVTEGQWPAATIPLGKNIALGNVAADLSKLAAPGAYKLVVRVGPAAIAPAENGAVRSKQGGSSMFENAWDFWLYPSQTNGVMPADILVTSVWDEAEARLAAGGKVLFLPRQANLDWSSPPLDNIPVFWNRLMNPGWSRMMGLWCDMKHPALAEFPTQANCDWQWTDLVRRVRAVNLDRLPSQLDPIVSAIDDWNRNYKLGLIFECKAGPGRLMVCAADLQSSLGERPVARQLRRSLLDYMAGPSFQPPVAVAAADLRALWFDTRIMRKLAARVQGDGVETDALLDGDPNTFWTAGGGGRGGNGRKHPYQITIGFPAAVKMNGLLLLNRQNDRDHLGDIRGFSVQASDDGLVWREVASGELLSTWNPQTVKFAAPITARSLKLTALSGFGNDTGVALAELAVLYAGPKLPDDIPDDVQYQRARSTSADVDESGPAAAPSKPPGSPLPGIHP
jgi:beta-galactosidase